MGGKPSIPTATSASPPPATAPSVPFFKNDMGGETWGVAGLFVFGLMLFLVGYFAIPDSSAGNNEIRTAFLVLGGLAAFLVAPIGFFMISKYSSNVGFGQNTGAIVTILIVAAIAFLIVFSPAMTGGGSPTLDAGGTAAVVLAVLIAMGIGVGGLLYYAKDKGLTDVIRRFGLILYFFLPYSLFVFGPIVDTITSKFQFIPSSIVGVTSIFINWAIATFFNNGVSPVSSNVSCEIPGLVGFSSNLVPQPMMASLSTLAYIATYISRSTLSGSPLHPSISFTNPGGAIWPVWALYGSVAAVYIASLMSSQCLTLKTVLPAVIAPTVYGGIFGILGFEFLAPRYDPGSPAATNMPAVLGKTGSTTPTVGTCAAGSSDGEFICESFENGKLKTKVITE